jgi:hypothetical protein
MYSSWEDKLIIKLQKENPYTKIIGAYGGETEQIYQDCDIVVSISLKYMEFLKKEYPNKPVIFLPESVDTNYFKPNNILNRCIFGWAGRLSSVKRHHLLDKLKYPIIKKSDWDKKFFVKERTLEPMKDFYKSIDVFVLTSQSECMPRVVLEAMACGLPIISTDVGSLKLIIEDEWLIFNTEDEKNVIAEINKRMEILNKYPEIRKRVGERNRKFIEEHFSWKITQPLWDSVFKLIYNGDYKGCVNITNKFLLDLDDSVTSHLGREAIDIPITSNHIKIKLEKINSIPVAKPIIPLKIIKEEKQETLLEKMFKPKPKIENITKEERYRTFFKELNSNDIKYWLIKNSCLERIVLRELKTELLNLGTCDINNQNKINLIAEQFKIPVEITIENRKIKEFSIYGETIFVPIPVVEYLYRIFGKDNLIKKYGEEWIK